MRYLVLITLLALTANGATWYCRPPVISGWSGGAPIPVPGTYGAQDGTSYADAWNGLREVVWGAGGVDAGDTLYVCGPHVHRSDSGNLVAQQAEILVTASGTDEAKITIRMDYPSDPGEVFGFWEDMRRSWTGPDGNGVYQQVHTTQNLYDIYFESAGTPEIGGGNISTINETNVTTWVGGLGTTYRVTDGSNQTNFVKTTTGDAPANNVYSISLGYRFNVLTSSNIVFSNCRFFSSQVSGTRPADGSLSCNKITFTNSVFQMGSHISLYPKMDDWSFLNCTMVNQKWGVYVFTDSKAVGVDRLTVSGCTISDMGLWRYIDGDAHGVGVQGGTGHLIERNNIQRTGSAIEFWTHHQGMSNNVVRFNFIKDIAVKSTTGGGGIVISGDGTAAVAGLRTGYQIYGNIVINTGVGQTEDWQGNGISGNNRDAMLIYNNVVSNANRGISRSISSGSPVPADQIYNNIVLAPRTHNMRFLGVGDSLASVDYNLFYPSPNISDKFSVSPSFTHNVNSIFADPLLFSDFRPSPTSPAIGAGTSVGLSTDYAGRAWKNPPAIGAYEFWESMSRATNLNVGTLRGR